MRDTRRDAWTLFDDDTAKKNLFNFCQMKQLNITRREKQIGYELLLMLLFSRCLDSSVLLLKSHESCDRLEIAENASRLCRARTLEWETTTCTQCDRQVSCGVKLQS